MRFILYQILIIIYSVFVILATVNYFLLYPIPDFFIKIKQIVIVLMLFSSGLLIGKRVNSLMKNNFNSELENNIFASGIGLGFYILLTFLCGVLGLYYRILFWIFVMLPLAVLYKDLWKLLVYSDKVIRNLFRYNWNFIKTIIFLIICFCSIFIFISCFAPPTYYDSLVYHLALPQNYITAKKIFFVPFSLYCYFPQNMEMLFSIGLLLGNENSPNLISFFMLILIILGGYSFCKTFLQPVLPQGNIKTLGLITGFIFITAPFVMLLSSSSYVEAGLTFYTFLAVYSFLLFLKQNSTKYIILSGIFCGFALGVKYTGIITLFCLTLLLIIKMIKDKNLIAGLRHIAILNCITLFLFLPWGVRNFINVSNPVFPFLYNTIGYRNVGWTTETAKNYFSLFTEYQHKSSAFIELFHFPWKLIESTFKYGGGIDVLGDFGWVMYLLIIPLLLFIPYSSTVGTTSNTYRISRMIKFPKIDFPINWLLLYCLGHFSIWFFTKPVLRFIFPLSIILSIICSFCIIMVLKGKSLVLKFILLLIIIFFTVSNFYIYFYVQSIIKPFEVAIGLRSKNDYLTNNLRFSPYPVFEHMNRNLSNTDKIFFVGEQRGFYCEKNYVAPNVFAPNPLISWSDTSKDYKELRLKLRNFGITHVLYNENEGKRLESYGILDFSSHGEKNWKHLLDNSNLVYSHNKVYLYSL